MIPAKEIEPKRDDSPGRIACAFTRKTTPVTARKSTAPPREPAHEGQALRTVSLYAARSLRPLRSQGRAPPLRETRHRTSGEHRPIPRKTNRRQECATVFSIDATAQPIVARSVRDGLASSGTTPGERPSAPESAPTVSEFVGRTTVDFYLVTRPPSSCGDDPAAISASR
jgi:hypothetical protein